MGYVELSYNKPDISKEQRSAYMKVIYENSVRANNLITDLFELSKMESTEYVLNKTSVDICEYMRRTMGGFIAIFDNAGFTYNFNIPEDEIFMEIDVKQMDRVFQNLVENSVKYNPKGTNIGISLSEQSRVIEIIFKDNGIGIASETAKNIFESFVRVERSRNSETGGTGLGLAIVEKIIQAHGGRISLNTNENCGCEFMISIPII
jgi:signal transduction histidine kinase